MRSGTRQQKQRKNNKKKVSLNPDDVPIRGTRLLSEVYERSNVDVLEPA